MKDKKLMFDRKCHVLYSKPCKKEILAKASSCAGIVAKVRLATPFFIPACVEQQKVGLPGKLQPAIQRGHGYGLAIGYIAAVYLKRPAYEAACVKCIQARPLGIKMRRRVNMRSRVRVHAKKRLLKAILFIRVGRL